MTEKHRLLLYQRQQLDFLVLTYSSSHPFLFVVCNGLICRQDLQPLNTLRFSIWNTELTHTKWLPKWHTCYCTQAKSYTTCQTYIHVGKAFCLLVCLSSTKPYTISLDSGYAYSTRALTAGVDVMEKAITYSVIVLVFGELACILCIDRKCAWKVFITCRKEQTWFIPVTCFTVIKVERRWSQIVCVVVEDQFDHTRVFWAPWCGCIFIICSSGWTLWQEDLGLFNFILLHFSQHGAKNVPKVPYLKKTYLSELTGLRVVFGSHYRQHCLNRL